MTLGTIEAATEWLALHLDELRKPPTRLHDAALGESGAPRYSAAFWAILAGGPYDAYDVEETRSCTDHPYGAACFRCQGNLTYTVPRRLYRHPLSAALARLRHERATSPDWPSPFVMCVALLRCDLDVTQAAWAIGHPPGSRDEEATVQAAFLLALRKLYSRWASGPMPKARGISEAQGDAEAAA